MLDYRHSSVDDISNNWDNICLNIFSLFNEVSERIEGGRFRSNEELDKLEALYDEIRSTIDFDHIEDIASYIQNEKS
jgi:hypothetical protein